ncbi:unnamed protein product, partial [Musa hybrid cultivar]
ARSPRDRVSPPDPEEQQENEERRGEAALLLPSGTIHAFPWVAILANLQTIYYDLFKIWFLS